ncbi:hypothetical protein [Phormidesmis sp. 146-33]
MLNNEGHRVSQKGSVSDQITSLRKEDETLYNILAVDVWALAKTMEEFHPGFWAAFMKNREKALKRFIGEVVKTKPSDIRRPPFLR